eukprot:5422903-Pyramimonas_sp.AAC.1
MSFKYSVDFPLWVAAMRFERRSPWHRRCRNEFRAICDEFRAGRNGIRLVIDAFAMSVGQCVP